MDRQYLHSEKVIALEGQGVELQCRPPTSSNSKGLFRKGEFAIDLTKLEATCPNGITVKIEIGKTAEFPASECDNCPLREQCTSRKSGNGRSLQIHKNEELYQKLRVIENTSEGRENLRQRVDVEHGLSHVIRKQGKTARYDGVRKNTFDLRMIGAILNLERAQAFETETQRKAA